VVALLTATQPARLRPIPGRVAPGTEVTIDATLGAGLRDPRLFVSQPGAGIEERPLKPSGSRFAAKVRLVRKGEATVELLATGAGGPQVVAIRRVFVGIDPPRSPPPEQSGRDPGVKGVEAAIARLRTQHGLTSLRRDAELDAVAELHSREMARTGTFAHVLPSDGSVGEQGATTPVNGTSGSDSPPLTVFGGKQFLHAQSYGAAIDNQGNADCETGQRGYPKKLNQFDPQHRNLALDAHTPGNQGPTFNGRARVPKGETVSRNPTTGPQLATQP